MIDRAHDLPLNRQARALGISRGSVYYLPRAASSADLALMRAICAHDSAEVLSLRLRNLTAESTNRD